MELTADIIDEYRNTGGFDIIGSGRTKLEKEDQFEKGLEIIKKLGIKALVIIGGDDSNTNACVLACLLYTSFRNVHGPLVTWNSVLPGRSTRMSNFAFAPCCPTAQVFSLCLLYTSRRIVPLLGSGRWTDRLCRSLMYSGRWSRSP